MGRIPSQGTIPGSSVSKMKRRVSIILKAEAKTATVGVHLDRSWALVLAASVARAMARTNRRVADPWEGPFPRQSLPWFAFAAVPLLV